MRAVARRKPVVLVKGGSTAGGQRAAASHTGALATDDRIFEGACRQAGVTRALGIEEAFEAAATFATQPLPRGPNTAVVTTAGGWGVITADAIVRSELRLAPLADDLRAAIDEKLPPRWSRNNPVDLAGAETRDTIPDVLELVARHPSIDAVVYLGLGIQSNEAKLMKTGSFYPDHGLERIVGFHERQDARYAEAAAAISDRDRQAGAHRVRARGHLTGEPWTHSCPGERKALLPERGSSRPRSRAPVAVRAAPGRPVMRTFVRAFVRVLPAILAVAVGGAALTRVVDGVSDPAAAESGLTAHLATPVLSARRVVDELAQPVAEARLAAALQPVAASLGDSSCLRVTLNGQQIVDVHGDTPLIPASTQKLLTASVALDVLGADHKYTTTCRPRPRPLAVWSTATCGSSAEGIHFSRRTTTSASSVILPIR